MTYPGGAQGGYPGPGQQTQMYGQPPTGGGIKLNLEQILHIATAALGVLILFLGFAPIAAGVSFYENAFGWIPAMYFVGGLFALPAILPGDKKVGLNPAIVTLGVTLAFLFTVFSVSASLKAGGVMVLIFGIFQAIAAVGALLVEKGLIKLPPPSAPVPQFGQPGGYNPQSAPFPQQPAQPYGQQPQAQQPYAPPPGQFGQAPGTPPATPPGGYPQQS